MRDGRHLTCVIQIVTFHLLLNLAQDLAIEPKMVKRGIIKYLVEMLDRQTPELIVLAIGFLKRLSVVGDNKDEIVGASSC